VYVPPDVRGRKEREKRREIRTLTYCSSADGEGKISMVCEDRWRMGIRKEKRWRRERGPGNLPSRVNIAEKLTIYPNEMQVGSQVGASEQAKAG
jgi:hypothetical protein